MYICHRNSPKYAKRNSIKLLNNSEKVKVFVLLSSLLKIRFLSNNTSSFSNNCKA